MPAKVYRSDVFVYASNISALELYEKSEFDFAEKLLSSTMLECFHLFKLAEEDRVCMCISVCGCVCMCLRVCVCLHVRLIYVVMMTHSDVRGLFCICGFM